MLSKSSMAPCKWIRAHTKEEPPHDASRRIYPHSKFTECPWIKGTCVPYHTQESPRSLSVPPVGDKGKKDHPNSFSLQDGVCVLSTAADFVQCATPSVHTLQLLGTPPRVILLSLFLSLHQSIIGKRHPASFLLLTSFPPPGTRSLSKQSTAYLSPGFVCCLIPFLLLQSFCQ